MSHGIMATGQPSCCSVFPAADKPRQACDCADPSRASMDAGAGLAVLRLRQTSSFQKQQPEAIAWTPATDPPRPDELTKVEELPSPRDENMPSFTYSNRGDAVRPDLTAGLAGIGDSVFLPPELQNAPATQPAHAASVQMSVNNCHMLQYRATKLAANASATDSQSDMELIPVPSKATMQRQPLQGTSTKRSLLAKKSTMPRLMKPAKVQPALVTITAGEISLIRRDFPCSSAYISNALLLAPICIHTATSVCQRPCVYQSNVKVSLALCNASHSRYADHPHQTIHQTTYHRPQQSRVKSAARNSKMLLSAVTRILRAAWHLQKRSAKTKLVQQANPFV